jgi:hypothetical protein
LAAIHFLMFCVYLLLKYAADPVALHPSFLFLLNPLSTPPSG